MHTKSLQSCLTLCGPMDYSPLGPSVCGILQARILEWVAMPSSRASYWPRDQTCVSFISWIPGKLFTTEAPATLHYSSKWLSPYQCDMNFILIPMTTYFCSEILYTTEKSWSATTGKQNKNNNTKHFPNTALFFFLTIMTAWFVLIDKFIVFLNSFLTLGKLMAPVAVTFKSSVIPVILERCGCIHVSLSVMSDSLRFCSLPGSSLCPWNSPGESTGVLLQGIFPTQGSNLGFPHYRQILYHLSHQERVLFRFLKLTAFLSWNCCIHACIVVAEWSL